MIETTYFVVDVRNMFCSHNSDLLECIHCHIDNIATPFNRDCIQISDTSFPRDVNLTLMARSINCIGLTYLIE